jgi:glycosyltransferase involved in cell wall biosynthesis
MKIGCININDTRDPHSFGGRLKGMIRALESHATEFHHLSPLHYPLPTVGVSLAKKVFYKYICHQRYFIQRDPTIVRSYGRQLRKRMAGLHLDVTVSLVSTGSQPVSYLSTDVPIVIWTDNTWAGTVDFYPDFLRPKLSQETLAAGYKNEAAALQRAALLLYMSEWAAAVAVQTYTLDPGKVKVLPVGPSLDPRFSLDAVRTLVARRPCDRCQLVFLGLEWDRKGGPLAVDVARRLNEAGLPTTLTVIGTIPNLESPYPVWLRATGFLDQEIPEQRDRLIRILSDSHFLVVPSRAEAFGIIFGEASAFGVPSLSTRVGGITTAIHDDVNGMTFPITAGPQPYCDFILAHFTDFLKYQTLALATFADYQARLAWPVITQQLGTHLGKVCGDRHAQGAMRDASRPAEELSALHL